MQFVQNNIKRYSDNTTYSIKCKSIITHNIPVILESYNYDCTGKMKKGPYLFWRNRRFYFAPG